MVNESENILDDMTSETQSDLESVIDDSWAKDDQVVDMAQVLEELQKSNDQNLDMAQRAQAELANYRKRVDDERLTQQQYANSRLIIRLLPIVDELEMALEHSEDTEINASWLDGIKLIHRKVIQMLEAEGLHKIDAIGQAFDPLQHEAVSTEDSNEVATGYIVGVLRNGYKLHDRIIQPAQVVVAR